MFHELPTQGGGASSSRARTACLEARRRPRSRRPRPRCCSTAGLSRIRTRTAKFVLFWGPDGWLYRLPRGFYALAGSVGRERRRTREPHHRSIAGIWRSPFSPCASSKCFALGGREFLGSRFSTTTAMRFLPAGRDSPRVHVVQEERFQPARRATLSSRNTSGRTFRRSPAIGHWTGKNQRNEGVTIAPRSDANGGGPRMNGADDPTSEGSWPRRTRK